MITKTSSVKLVTAAEPCLKLAYRRYQLRSRSGEHGSSLQYLPKQLYEPLLHHIDTVNGEAISMDLRNHGDSAVANRLPFESGQATTGNMLKTLDMNNKKEPIIGIGHSAGATALLLTEAAYPGTFSAIIAIDPIVSTVDLEDTSMSSSIRYMSNATDDMAAAVKRRRDNWPSREVAYNHLYGRGMFTNWDKDAFKSYIQYGLQQVDSSGHVALKMPTTMESVGGILSGKHLLYSNFKNLSKINIPVLFIAASNSNMK
ncbi:Alpha/Beta hydrolase protein [Syncephalis plumigaleata]|nr:Alpha/Beta hydrolase protein [Syncephalis plumigaleata]